MEIKSDKEIIESICKKYNNVDSKVIVKLIFYINNVLVRLLKQKITVNLRANYSTKKEPDKKRTSLYFLGNDFMKYKISLDNQISIDAIKNKKIQEALLKYEKHPTNRKFFSRRFKR